MPAKNFSLGQNLTGDLKKSGDPVLKWTVVECLANNMRDCSSHNSVNCLPKNSIKHSQLIKNTDDSKLAKFYHWTFLEHCS